MLEARYGVPWTTPVDREGPFVLAIEGEAHAQDQVAELELVVRNRSPRWIARPIVELSLPTGAKLAYDQANHPVVLFPNDWSANYFSQPNPGITLSALPPNDLLAA